MSTIPSAPADVEQILEANEPKFIRDPIESLGEVNPRDEAAGCPTGLDSAPKTSPQEDEDGKGATEKKSEQ